MVIAEPVVNVFECDGRGGKVGFHERFSERIADQIDEVDSTSGLKRDCPGGEVGPAGMYLGANRGTTLRHDGFPGSEREG